MPEARVKIPIPGKELSVHYGRTQEHNNVGQQTIQRNIGQDQKDRNNNGGYQKIDKCNCYRND